MPGRLQERYLEAIADQELLNLRRDIATLEARIEDLLLRVDSGESGELWRELGALRQQFLMAQRAQDQDRMQAALLGLLNAVNRGESDFLVWAEVANVMERRRRLVESEQKRLVAMQQMVTAEQATALIAVLATSVRGHVLEHCNTDIGRTILDGIQRDLDRFVSVGIGALADG